MAAKVHRVHGPKALRLLGRMEAIVNALAADLDQHMRKEELVLFPAIRAIAGGDRVRGAAAIAAPIG